MCDPCSRFRKSRLSILFFIFISLFFFLVMSVFSFFWFDPVKMLKVEGKNMPQYENDVCLFLCMRVWEDE